MRRLQAHDTGVLSETSKRLLPWLVAVGFFMESLDTTILNTAVPAIANALKVPPLSMKAVLASYTLSLAVFIPISGWMANRFGTRRVFASAIGIFTLGSFLCGISNEIHLLVACRVLQGCGGAMMLPVGRLTMVRTFAKSELIGAMSFVAMPGLIGPMLGPLLGGLIIGYFHWSVIFFVNIPIGLCGLYMVYRHLPNYREKRNYPLDIVGLVLFGSGIALLSYVLEVFGETTLSGREILGLLTISAALLGVNNEREAAIVDAVLAVNRPGGATVVPERVTAAADVWRHRAAVEVFVDFEFLPDLDDGGVVLNLGSAVVMPEVFLKALTIARNLNGGRPKNFTACDCDMQRHYRPRVNVVERPTLAGGRGIQLTGHHEILVPLIAWAVLSRIEGK